jgi:hypothetical protein
MGFQGRMKWIFFKLNNLFGKLCLQLRVLVRPLLVDLLEPLLPRLSSTIQIRQKIFCRPAPAFVFL